MTQDDVSVSKYQVERSCAYCGKGFIVMKAKVTAKTGLFCSISCSASGVERKIRSLEDRLMSRVIKLENDCWEWQGYVHKVSGYGYMGLGRRSGGTQGVHRISYLLHNGPIPEGQNVCHHCDNRICVNPAHLFTGTDADNMADKVAKGRHAKGDDTRNAKLREDDVRAIRLLSADGTSSRDLADRFEVSQASITNIRARRSWKHVA